MIQGMPYHPPRPMFPPFMPRPFDRFPHPRHMMRPGLPFNGPMPPFYRPRFGPRLPPPPMHPMRFPPNRFRPNRPGPR